MKRISLAATPHSLLKKQGIVLFLLLATRALGTWAIPGEIGANPGQKRAISLALPSRLGAWTGRDIQVDPVVYEVLQPDAVLQKRFRLAPQKPGALAPEVEVLVVYSRDPKGLHSPVTCLRAQGWTLTDQSTRVVRSGGQTLQVEVLKGQQREMRTQLAYCFTDASESVSGRVATFAKMIAARVMRRRIGAVEMQFAYDARVLKPNGEFSREMCSLMIETARAVRTQLTAPAPGS